MENNFSKVNVYFWNINNLRTQSKIYKVTVKEKRTDIRRKKYRKRKIFLIFK